MVSLAIGLLVVGLILLLLGFFTEIGAFLLWLGFILLIVGVVLWVLPSVRARRGPRA